MLLDFIHSFSIDKNFDFFFWFLSNSFFDKIVRWLANVNSGLKK